MFEQNVVSIFPHPFQFSLDLFVDVHESSAN